MPGALGTFTNSPVIDEGTSIRTASLAHVAYGGGADAGHRVANEHRMAYVDKVANDGWLRTRLGTGNPAQYVYLCKYTALDVIESKAGRTYFKPLDGSHAGELLSLTDANLVEFVGSKAPVPNAARATLRYGSYVPKWKSEARRGELLDQQFAVLTIDALSVQVTMNTVWLPEFSPIPAGNYRLLIPDTPHNANMTRFYRDSESTLVYDQVWFPIQYGNNSRYVHVGNVSEGCTTVIDLARWADVHEALISHRAPDGKSVGTLSVTGKPERTR